MLYYHMPNRKRNGADTGIAPGLHVFIIAPVYNEEQIIEEFFQRVCDVVNANTEKREISDKKSRQTTRKTSPASYGMDSATPITARALNIHYHLILVNDGSKDRTPKILEKIHKKQPEFVTVINLARNFGHQAALKAGYDYVYKLVQRNKIPENSVFVVTIDSDLQDPPELIPKMVQKVLAKQADLVVAKRRVRKEQKLKTLTADLFYRLMRAISSAPIDYEVADYRLISFRLLEQAVKKPLRPLFWRGFFSYLTNHHEYVYYNRTVRKAGQTKYSILKMLKLAIAGVVNFGDRLVTYYILSVLVVGMLLFGWAFVGLLGGSTFCFGSVGTWLGLGCESYGVQGAWHITFGWFAAILSVLLLLAGMGIVVAYVWALRQKDLPAYVLKNVLPSTFDNSQDSV